MSEYFLTDLLEGSINSSKEIEERLKYIDFKIMKDIYILSICVKRGNLANVYLPYIRDLVATLITNSKTTIYNDYIVVLFSRKEKLILNRDMKSVLEILEQHQLHCGLSRCFHDLIKTREYYLQSLKAMELGIRINNDKVFYAFEDYALFNLLDVYSKRDKLKNFCHPVIFILMEHDRKNNSNYLDSLYIYLTKQKNMVKTAHEMHTHRSTMEYRINKIREITGIDLDDTNLITHLLLSFMALEFSGEISLPKVL